MKTKKVIVIYACKKYTFYFPIIGGIKMSKQILKYTIRVNKKYNDIEIFIRDYPACGCAFTCVSNEGHSAANGLYYSQQTRPATNEEIEQSKKEGVLKDFLSLYSDDYELQYLKRLPR